MFSCPFAVFAYKDLCSSCCSICERVNLSAPSLRNPLCGIRGDLLLCGALHWFHDKRSRNRQ